jgi:hypothetical protein
MFNSHNEKEKYVVDKILEFVPEFRQLFIQHEEEWGVVRYIQNYCVIDYGIK